MFLENGLASPQNSGNQENSGKFPCLIMTKLFF